MEEKCVVNKKEMDENEERDPHYQLNILKNSEERSE
jgi:hypothetical protein